MKNIFHKLPILLIAITFTYSLTHLPIINQMTESTFLTLQQLFFSLYFLMFLFSIMNSTGIFNIIGKILSPIFYKLLYLDETSSAIYFASFFSGYPTFAKIIKDAFQNNQITKDSANHLLLISSHGSIGFIVLTLGNTLFQNIKIGWILYFIQILSNIIIAFLVRKKSQENKVISIQIKLPFIKIIKNEMLACLKVFVYIYGFMLVFNILNHILFQSMPLLHGFLEFSQGCLNLKNQSFEIKFIMSNIYISFSSLSVIFQVSSLLDGLDLNIKNYIKARILQAFISLLLSLGFLCII